MFLSDTGVTATPLRQNTSTMTKPPPSNAQAPLTSGGTTPLSGGISNFFQSLVTTAGQVLQISNQQRLADENLRRARAGLQPLTYQDVPGMVPTVQVQAGLDDTSQRNLMLMFGIGAIAIVAVMMGGKKRR